MKTQTLLSPKHPLCTTEEFGLIVRLVTAVVRRQCRQGKIKFRGSPMMIHISEAAKWGISISECLDMLLIIRAPAPLVEVDKAA